ncbi:MAG TPA: TfoX/Sxy family protein [Rhizobiaceae bacterium]|nr:TfoX/Sxy family protein [Rhizobiaceae bacterium]
MNAELEERLRKIIGKGAAVGEVRMFGGLCFTLNGNMQICVRRDGSLLARVGAKNAAKAVKKTGVKRMVMRGREMADYVTVTRETFTDKALRAWVAMTGDYVAALPKKPKAR